MKAWNLRISRRRDCGKPDPVKLLIVEDEPRMLELLHRGLTEEGHTVVCASDGEGWELAHAYCAERTGKRVYVSGRDPARTFSK